MKEHFCLKIWIQRKNYIEDCQISNLKYLSELLYSQACVINRLNLLTILLIKKRASNISCADDLENYWKQKLTINHAPSVHDPKAEIRIQVYLVSNLTSLDGHIEDEKDTKTTSPPELENRNGHHGS